MIELRMIAIVRADLNMPPGKMAVQVGHAFVQLFDQAHFCDRKEYISYGQPKIVLIAPDLNTLLKVKEKAEKKMVCAELITDAARTFFTEPTITVLGLGPLSKTDSNNLTRGLSLME